jgi:hypothetical protein
MKVKIELTDSVIQGIAYSEAEKASYHWFGSTGDVPDATALYAAAFQDGMKWLLNALEED